MRKISYSILSGVVAVSLVGTGAIAAAATPTPESSSVNIQASTNKGSNIDASKDLVKALYFGVGPDVAKVQKRVSDPTYDKYVAAASATQAN